MSLLDSVQSEMTCRVGRTSSCEVSEPQLPLCQRMKNLYLQSVHDHKQSQHSWQRWTPFIAKSFLTHGFVLGQSQSWQYLIPGVA